MKFYNPNLGKSPMDPDYVPFDFYDYESAMDEQADRDIEERLLAKYE